MIIRVQSTELSSVQRFVLRLIRDWGPGPERIGGIALLGCPLPRARRRAGTTADLLVWTPHTCTLVVVADFGSVQHGTLHTPAGSRWQVDDRDADLRPGPSAANPLQRARRQRAELAGLLRRHGLSEQIDVLVVLIPKTGSRMSWTPPPRESGEEVILVRIGQSGGLGEYFGRPADAGVRWRAADIAGAFEALGVSRSTPEPDELAAEGFPADPGRAPAPPPETPAGDRPGGGRFEKAGRALRRRATAVPGPVAPAVASGSTRETSEVAEPAVPPAATSVPEAPPSPAAAAAPVEQLADGGRPRAGEVRSGVANGPVPDGPRVRGAESTGGAGPVPAGAPVRGAGSSSGVGRVPDTAAAVRSSTDYPAASGSSGSHPAGTGRRTEPDRAAVGRAGDDEHSRADRPRPAIRGGSVETPARERESVPRPGPPAESTPAARGSSSTMSPKHCWPARWAPWSARTATLLATGSSDAEALTG
ncbi:hypothetical protein ACWDU1_17440, partial [Nocardia sp. NPDC003345]